MCQCPEWGDLHSYGLNVEDKSNNEGCVNALKGADLHFYGNNLYAKGKTETVSMP